MTSPNRLALQLGWSKAGCVPTPEAPRNCCRWNESEDSDLAAQASLGLTGHQLAGRHGRTYIAIEMRLAALDLTDPADDFRDELTDQLKEQHMKMTANRMMAMLAIYRGTYENELKVGTSGPDMAHLTAEGLVSVLGQRVELTAEGRNLVEAMLGRTSSSRSGATTAWDAKRDTSVLDDQRFFLVASGDCHKAGGGPAHDRPTLKSPPRVVQSSGRDAAREADRLARDNPGSKFFVLQATSVHQVPAPQPTFKQL